ncbi:MAG TPA: thioredoxin domain-containing protein [Tepidisphaeraceae bacterium]|jgi:protein-disulfide isomerase|nr:thioredoxin domain-containing protein [Tepidisphaeraceae bacterium]
MSDSNAPQLLTLPVSETDHIRGRPEAPLTLLEYGDYECDYCGRLYPIVRKLREHFGDRLRFVFRNFPVANIHPHASVAAQAAESAGMQGKFWEMHDLLYEHQAELAAADLTHYALKIGLEPYHFQSDLSSERFARRVAADHRSGLASGVTRTPTFFINGIRFDGKREFGELAAAIENVEQTRS